jgi:aspartyl protease family protein
MTKNSALVFAALVIAAALSIGRAPPTDRPAPPPARTDSAETTSRQPDMGDAVVLQREPDGHFYTNANVNGTPIRFMIDTGASSVALTRDDAQKSGLFLSENDFNEIGRAAGGEIRLRRVTLDRVAVGGIEARGVPGVVIGGNGDISLLGQSFLATLGSVTIEGDRMVLRPA